MKFSQKIYRQATIAAIIYMICWGAIISIFPLKPFWRDEWCMLHNIKFKSPAELWGPLDFTQQFPRIYLQAVKAIASTFNYSYSSLRLQSFFVAAAAIALTWNLARRIFADSPVRYLFILVIVGNPMFIDYLGQVKHYEMEMLMALVALWQYLEIQQYDKRSTGKTVLLYASFIVAPFFSYTYPIAIAPVLALTTLSAFFRKGVPLRSRVLDFSFVVVCSVAILLFYAIDASRVLQDSNMHNFWFNRPDYINGGLQKRSVNIWLFFAKTGAGAVFEYVFGIACLAATLFSAWQIAGRHNSLPDTTKNLLRYSLLLVALMIGFYFLDKIPLGQAKFSIFVTPALSLMLAFTLGHWSENSSGNKKATITTAILFTAMAGNILTAFLQLFTSEDYKLKLKIYLANSEALVVAQKENLPIIVTPAIGRPDDITVPVPYLSMPDAAGIVRTYPAYHIDDSVRVIPVGNHPSAQALNAVLPDGTGKYMVSDGVTITKMSRDSNMH